MQERAPGQRIALAHLPEGARGVFGAGALGVHGDERVAHWEQRPHRRPTRRRRACSCAPAVGLRSAAAAESAAVSENASGAGALEKSASASRVARVGGEHGVPGHGVTPRHGVEHGARGGRVARAAEGSNPGGGGGEAGEGPRPRRHALLPVQPRDQQHVGLGSSKLSRAERERERGRERGLGRKVSWFALCELPFKVTLHNNFLKLYRKSFERNI